MPLSKLTLAYDGEAVSTFTSTAAGAIPSGEAFAVPASPVGTNAVTVTDAAGNSAASPFSVVPSLAASPDSAAVGQVVQVSGTGFAPDEPLQFMINGTLLSTPTEVITNGAGSFSASITMSNGTVGTAPLSVVDLGGDSAEVSFTITWAPPVPPLINPEVFLEPPVGIAGTTVDVNGSGFEPETTIAVTYNGTLVIAQGCATNNAGTFSGCSFIVPQTPPGNFTVSATDGNNTASELFGVNQYILLGYAAGPPGTTLAVTGLGFTGDQNITIAFDGYNQTTTGGACATNATGYFSCSFTVPAMSSGSYVVAATDGFVAANSTFTIGSSIVPAAILPRLTETTGTDVWFAPAFEECAEAAVGLGLIGGLAAYGIRGTSFRARRPPKGFLVRIRLAVVVVVSLLLLPMIPALPVGASSPTTTSLVRSEAGSNQGVNTFSVSFGWVQSGDLLVALVASMYAGSQIPVSDSMGNYWNLAASSCASYCLQIYYTTVKESFLDTVVFGPTTTRTTYGFVAEFENVGTDLNVSSYCSPECDSASGTLGVAGFNPTAGALVLAVGVGSTGWSAGSSQYALLSGASAQNWESAAEYSANWNSANNPTTSPLNAAPTSKYGEVAAAFLPSSEHKVYSEVPYNPSGYCAVNGIVAVNGQCAYTYTQSYYFGNYTNIFAANYFFGHYEPGVWGYSDTNAGWVGNFNVQLGPQSGGLKGLENLTGPTHIDISYTAVSLANPDRSYQRCLTVDINGTIVTTQEARPLACTKTSVPLQVEWGATFTWVSPDLTGLVARYLASGKHDMEIQVHITDPSSGDLWRITGSMTAHERFEAWPDYGGDSDSIKSQWQTNPEPLGVASAAIYYANAATGAPNVLLGTTTYVAYGAQSGSAGYSPNLAFSLISFFPATAALEPAESINVLQDMYISETPLGGTSTSSDFGFAPQYGLYTSGTGQTGSCSVAGASCAEISSAISLALDVIPLVPGVGQIVGDATGIASLMLDLAGLVPAGSGCASVCDYPPAESSPTSYTYLYDNRLPQYYPYQAYPAGSSNYDAAQSDDFKTNLTPTNGYYAISSTITVGIFISGPNFAYYPVTYPQGVVGLYTIGFRFGTYLNSCNVQGGATPPSGCGLLPALN